MSWVGGKKALRDEILVRFPHEYKRYIEVFGGGGWVLFHKPRGDDFEVYNDFNTNLVNLYRCVREKPKKLIELLTYTLNSRLDFEYMRDTLRQKDKMCDEKRAAYFYQVIQYSYVSGLNTFGGIPKSMWTKFPLIHSASRRLQRVVIENKDFESLIKQYDRSESFFYLDPPYFSTEDYYEGGGFTGDDHNRLARCLFNIEGKFLLSYNDCPEIRDLYTKEGIYIESISRPNNMALRYVESMKEYAELLISNYDITEKARKNVQLTLFTGDSYMEEHEDEQEAIC